MQIHLLKAKIHRATVTDAHLDYEGSMGIDEDFMDQVDLRPFEKVLCGNLANGNRFETYAIPYPRGSRAIVLNGAVAHLGKIGDRLVIMAFGEFSPEEATTWKPKAIRLENENTEVAPIP